MAWKSKKKSVELSSAEKEYVKNKLEEYKNKFFKPIKGEIVFKVEGCNQEFVETARYKTEDEIIEDAKKIIERMNKISKGKQHWVLISAKMIGKSMIEDEDI